MYFPDELFGGGTEREKETDTFTPTGAEERPIVKHLSNKEGQKFLKKRVTFMFSWI